MRDERPFVKMFVGEADTRANETGASAHVRAFLLAVREAAPNGHAEFKRGALAAQLRTPNGQPRRDVKDVIRRAVDDGLLDPSSIPECLVLSPLVQVHAWPEHLRYKPCKTHGGAPAVKSSARCHPARPMKAHGLCSSCYQREWAAAKAERRAPDWVAALPPEREIVRF